MNKKNPENPFSINKNNDELLISISKELRDTDWAAYFGELQHAIRTKQWKGNQLNCLTINMVKCQWADPLPLLHFMLSMNEFHRVGGKITVILPLPTSQSSSFLKFLAQEGFLKLIFDNSTIVINNNGVLKPDIITNYCLLTADLAYVNSTIIQAELVKCDSFEVIDQWVEDRIDKAGGIVESRMPRWAFEDLMYRLKMFLIETLHNVFLHAYEEGRDKYSAVYTRFREGLLVVNPEQQTKLEGSLRDESFHCPCLTIEYLKEREGCIESFIADAGDGLSKTLSEKLITNKGKKPKKPFSFACEQIFINGLRRDGRKARTSTSGLNLLARLLDQDFIRGIDADEWYGTTLPLNRPYTAISIPVDGNECCGSIVKGLSWMIRLSWQSSTDFEKAGWCQFDNDLPNHPILLNTGSLSIAWFPKVETWLVDDRRLNDLDSETGNSESIANKPEQELYLLLVRPGFAKNDILNHVEDIAKNIQNGRHINLIIADIPTREAVTYASALNNTKMPPVTQYMRWPSKFQKITLISQSLSSYVLDYDVTTNGYKHNKVLSEELLWKDPRATFDPSSNIYHLFYWLKYHDSVIFWDYIEKALPHAFVNGRIKWTENCPISEMKGYLDFAQTLPDLFCRRIYWMALLRISGLSSKIKYRLMPMDSYTKSLATIYNAKILPVLKGMEESIYIGSIKVSGLTEEEAMARSEHGLQSIALHYFTHTDSTDYQKTASLLFWANSNWIKKQIIEKSGYKRVGQSSTIAQGGSKYFTIPRYNKSGESLYERSPKDSYKDWQSRNPVLVKMGHWEYQAHHDLITVNLWSALKYSFTTYGSLACFLMSEFFKVLGIMNDDDLTIEGKRWYDKLYNYTPSTNPSVCAIIYPSHSTTDFVIENLFKAILPENKRRVVAVHPVRKINSGSPALVSPLVLDVISKLIEDSPSKDVLFFDDALVTGRTIAEMETLLKERGARNVYKLCILERRRLPGGFVDPNIERIYWRLDVPALGDSNSCVVCKALSEAEHYSRILVSHAAKERIRSWINDWRVVSTIMDWWEKGLTPVKATLKDPNKKFGIKRISSDLYEQIGGDNNKITMHNSSGLNIYASELHSMTSNDAYALELMAKDTSLSDISKIELISSQLILFHGEFSAKTQCELLRTILFIAQGIEETNKYTSLTALVSIIQNPQILSKIIIELFNEEAFSDHLMNEDVLLVIAYAMNKDQGLFNKIKGKINSDRARRLLMTDINISTIYDTIHSELYGDEGDIHNKPLSRFGEDASYDILGKSINSKIWDADSNISLIKYLVNQIDPRRIRKQDLPTTTFDMKKDIIIEMERNMDCLSRIKNDLHRTAEQLSVCKNSVTELISSLKIFHSGIFYNLYIKHINENKGYPFEDDELIHLLADITSDEWKASFQKKCVDKKWDEKPIILLSHSGDIFPVLERKNVWVIWDREIKKIVKDLMTNVLHRADKISDPWHNTKGIADLWINVKYNKYYLSITLANAYNSTIIVVDHEARKKQKWLTLEELGGSVKYSELNTEIIKVLLTKIKIPYAGCIKQNKSLQEYETIKSL